MAINITPPNFSGGMSSGNGQLNIQVPGALGLQALQQASAQENARRSAMLEQMQLQQQGAQVLGNQSIQRAQLQQQGVQAQQLAQIEQQKMAFDREKMAQDGGQSDRTFKQEDRKLSILDKGNELDAAVKLQRQSMAKLLDEKKETLHKKGAFASYGRISLEKAKSPGEAQQISVEMIKEAVANGYVSEDQGKQFLQAPIQLRKNMLDRIILETGTVTEYKNILDANKPPTEKSKAGVTEIYDPETGKLVYSSKPSSVVNTRVMEDVKNKGIALQRFDEIEKGYNPEYFTNKNRFGNWLSTTAEENKGIPILEAVNDYAAEKITGKNPEERAAFIDKRTAYLNSVEQVFNTYKHEITGSAAGLQEIESLRKSFLNGDMSPSEFKGALRQVIDKYKSESDANKKILNLGLDTTPSEDEGLRQHFKQNGKTDAEINAYFKEHI